MFVKGTEDRGEDLVRGAEEAREVAEVGRDGCGVRVWSLSGGDTESVVAGEGVDFDGVFATVVGWEDAGGFVSVFLIALFSFSSDSKIQTKGKNHTLLDHQAAYTYTPLKPLDRD